MNSSCLKVVLISALLLMLTSSVSALPFNDDMVDPQISAGQVMRQKVEGTIPLGSLASKTESRTEADGVKNPRPETVVSVINGKRLYEANCSACHGSVVPDGTVHIPPLVKFGIPAPNLGASLYKRSDNPSEGRTDGYIFGTVRHGGALMPALGYKLSANEIWDIVNYVRSKQEG
jgi:mono/diheme cytochrome c family protein